MTTPEQNMAACREFNERVLNEGDVSYAEKVLRDDFVDHSPPPGGAGDKASTIAMFQWRENFATARRRSSVSVVPVGFWNVGIV